MKPSSLRLLRSLLHDTPKPCTQCHRRLFQTTTRRLNTTPPTPTPTGITGLPRVDISPARSIAPRMLPKSFIPKPLGAPIGVKNKPKPEDDPRYYAKGDMFAPGGDWEDAMGRNTATRRHLLKEQDRSHVRDYRNVALAKDGGKFYLANSLIYREDKSLYFPNLLGKTLMEEGVNTTGLLSGWVSVVTLFERKWGFGQTRSFLGREENPELHELLGGNEGTAQLVDISMEKVAAFKFIARMFERELRKGKTEEEMDRYFMASAVPLEIKEALGVMNSSVGYVFLVDQNCKIRWAGCAEALPEEKESLVKGLRTLITKAKRKTS